MKKRKRQNNNRPHNTLDIWKDFTSLLFKDKINNNLESIKKINSYNSLVEVLEDDLYSYKELLTSLDKEESLTKVETDKINRYIHIYDRLISIIGNLYKGKFTDEFIKSLYAEIIEDMPIGIDHIFEDSFLEFSDMNKYNEILHYSTFNRESGVSKNFLFLIGTRFKLALHKYLMVTYEDFSSFFKNNNMEALRLFEILSNIEQYFNTTDEVIIEDEIASYIARSICTLFPDCSDDSNRIDYKKLYLAIKTSRDNAMKKNKSIALFKDIYDYSLKVILGIYLEELV